MRLLRRLIKLITPDMVLRTLEDIPLEVLRRKNITNFALDCDNTLIPWYRLKIPERVKIWINKVKSEGFEVYITSNSVIPSKVRKVAESLGVKVITRAGKPWKRNVRKILAKMGAKPETVAFIGDLLFSDVLGGNLVGAFTILVITPVWWEVPIKFPVKFLEKAILMYLIATKKTTFWGRGRKYVRDSRNDLKRRVSSARPHKGAKKVRLSRVRFGRRRIRKGPRDNGCEEKRQS